jgi:hypothetical protein
MNEYGNTQSEAAQYTLPFSEAANQINAEPHLLWYWSQRFAPFLGDYVGSDRPRYTIADMATLRTIQVLAAQGYDDEQITQQLSAVKPAAPATNSDQQYSPPPAAANNFQPQRNQLTPSTIADNRLAGSIGEVFSTISDGQQAILNNQSTVREVIGVLVQDNFNLKDENRKLRERMLELERALAEYQRREETRKERLESRLRAVEGTIGGLQQQIAQLVQMLRKRRRGLFW